VTHGIQPTHDIPVPLRSLTGGPKARPPCAQDGYGLICHSDGGAFLLILTGPSASSQRLLRCRPYPNSSSAVRATVNSGLPRYGLTPVLAQIQSIRCPTCSTRTGIGGRNLSSHYLLCWCVLNKCDLLSTVLRHGATVHLPVSDLLGSGHRRDRSREQGRA
jgi:hypothetical protein